MRTAAGRDAPAFPYYRRLRRVRRYVDQHLADELSLRRVARIANLEKKYFSAFFAAKTGTCFNRWLAQRRVTMAIDMMSRNNASITEIAFAVGFRDLRTFERSFKKCTGLTPTGYKQSIATQSLAGTVGRLREN